MFQRTAIRKTGHTLAELVISVAASGILIVGLTSTLYVASRAVDHSGPTQRTLAGATAAQEVLNDLQFAVALTERSANAVEFTVASRDADATPETIRYAWSGTPGDPLTRQYNGGTVVSVVDDVHEFQLSYRTRTVSDETPGPIQEQPYVAVVYLVAEATAEQSYVVSTDTWCAQSFLPDPATLPADAIEWRLDTVRFRIMQAGQAKGVTRVQLLRRDAAGLPTGAVLDEFDVAENGLDKTNWTPTWFPEPISAPWLPATEGLCLLLKPSSGTDTCAALYQTTTTPAAVNVSFLETSTGGASWTAHGDLAMTQFNAYATVRTQGPPQGSTTYFLARADVTLRVGPDASTRIDNAVNVLNEPQVAGP